jgi:hypothetical protein
VENAVKVEGVDLSGYMLGIQVYILAEFVVEGCTGKGGAEAIRTVKYLI